MNKTTILKRYTDLPYLIEILSQRKIYLLNPNSWDDQNDSYYIKKYCKYKNVKNAYALCMTNAPETYHHWKIFTNGTNGVCIEFNSNTLINSNNNTYNAITKEVHYPKLSQHLATPFEKDELPFFKRFAFRDEREVRIFTTSNNNDERLEINIDLTCILRVIINPWMPDSTANTVINLIKKIQGCEKINVSKSKIINNEKWKSLANIQ